MNKGKVKDNIIILLENIVKRTEIIEKQSGNRNLLEIDLVMEDLRSLYTELELLRKITEKDCVSDKNQFGDINPIQHTSFPPEKEPAATNQDNVSLPAREDNPSSNVAADTQKGKQDAEQVAHKENDKPLPINKQDDSTEPETKIASGKKEKDDNTQADKHSDEATTSSNTRNQNKEHVETPHEITEKEKKVASSKTVLEKPSPEKRVLGEKFAENGNSVNERLATIKDDKSIGARMQLKPISNLKDAIGINEKFLFINELFNGDLTAYNEAIEKLNSSSSIHEAFELLNLLTSRYSWDGQRSADTIEKFANLVQRRFMSK